MCEPLEAVEIWRPLEVGHLLRHVLLIEPAVFLFLFLGAFPNDRLV